MTNARRFAIAGGVFGFLLAAFFIWPQAVADLRGHNIIGPAEGMFIVSLPVSLLTWLVWLLPASALFGSGPGEIPRWVAYTWMAITPPINWGVIGWLIGKWRDP